ncbi:hypothetical protein QY96_00266 [Bacillus thermotolerans]|nr:hypothetical protein QY96_00266 [Bacillus thermotolerans]
MIGFSAASMPTAVDTYKLIGLIPCCASMYQSAQALYVCRFGSLMFSWY